MLLSSPSFLLLLANLVATLVKTTNAAGLTFAKGERPGFCDCLDVLPDCGYYCDDCEIELTCFANAIRRGIDSEEFKVENGVEQAVANALVCGPEHNRCREPLLRLPEDFDTTVGHLLCLTTDVQGHAEAFCDYLCRYVHGAEDTACFDQLITEPIFEMVQECSYDTMASLGSKRERPCH